MTLLGIFDADTWQWVHDWLVIELFQIGNHHVTIASLLVALLAFFGSRLFSKAVQRGIRTGMRSRNVSDEGTIAVAQKLAHYLIMIVGIGIALEALGVDLGALFAAGAVFAIGVGFALQGLAQNFVSGVILMIERSITPGDIINSEGDILRVKRMGIRSTTAVNRDGEDVLLPNTMLVQNKVRNLTLDENWNRVSVSVGVAYESDLRAVKKALDSVANRLHAARAPHKPSVLLTEFAESSVNFSVLVWTGEPWGIPKLRSDLHFAIWDALDDVDVTIAYPQIDVHFPGGIPSGEDEKKS